MRMKTRCGSSFGFLMSVMVFALISVVVLMGVEGAESRTLLQVQEGEEAEDYAICGGKNHPCGKSRPCSKCKSPDFRCKPQVNSETGEKNTFFWQCLPSKSSYIPATSDGEEVKAVIEAEKEDLLEEVEEAKASLDAKAEVSYEEIASSIPVDSLSLEDKIQTEVFFFIALAQELQEELNQELQVFSG